MSSLIYMEYYDSDSNMQISDRDSIAIKDIDGYELDTEKAYSIYFDSLNNENKIQIFYKNKIKGSVNVKYIEKNSGEEIQQSKLYDELELGTYDFVAEELENFKLVSDKDISVNLNKENPNQEIEFIYEVDKDKIDINEVPYISTYYIVPENDINDDIKIEYYVTDYNQKEYLYGDTSEEFKVDYWINGEKKTLSNIKAGNNFIDLGKLPEGEYSFDLQVTDKYFRKSHKLFNEFKVVDKEKEDLIQKEKTYSPTKDELLSKFNIYSDNTNPVETTKGLNDLIQYASKNGYRKVVLPYGIYAIDENNTVKVNVSNFILDLNGSTFKINPNSNSSYLTCELSGNIENSHVVNGIFMGDLNQHDYSISSSSEFGNAFCIKGADYSSFENLTVENYVGYGATTLYDSYPINDNGLDSRRREYWVPNGENNRSFSDIVNGVNVPCNNRISTTTFLSLKAGFRSNIDDYNFLTLGFFCLGNPNGYQGNVTDNWVYIAHFYDENYNYIESIEGYAYRTLKFNKDKARYVKFTFLTSDSNLINTDNIMIFTRHNPINSCIKKIQFKDIRCVGSALCGFDNMLVDECSFSHCGWAMAKCAWDAEDGWDMMHDLTIRNTKFIPDSSNGNIYLNCAGHNFIAENNEDFGAFQYERCRGFVYRNNIMNNSYEIRRDSLNRSGYFRSYNNTINKSLSLKQNTDNNSIVIRNEIINNTIYGRTEGSHRTIKLYNCNINNTTSIGNNGLEIYDSNLNNVSGYISETKFYNCNFTQTGIGLNSKVYSSIFENCNFNGTTSIYGAPLVKFKNCKFDSLYINFGNSNDGNIEDVIFENCTIVVKEASSFIYLRNSVSNIGMKFINCTIVQEGKTNFFDIQSINMEAVFDNCIIKKTEGTFLTGYYPSMTGKSINIHLINTNIDKNVTLNKWAGTEGINIISE